VVLEVAAAMAGTASDDEAAVGIEDEVEATEVD